jgi:hypothetical protein
MKLTWSYQPHRFLTGMFVLGGLLSAVICAPAAVVLVPAGATWKFLDAGVDLGTAWRAAAFSDAAWAHSEFVFS